MYLETIASIGLLLALIATHWMRRHWGLAPFFSLLSAGAFASISGAIVPSDQLNGIAFSSTVVAGALLVLFLDGPNGFRQTMAAMGLVALIAILIRWAASTLPTQPSLFGSLENSLQIIGIGTAVFLIKVGWLQTMYRRVWPKQPPLAAILGLFGITIIDIGWANALGMGFLNSLACLIHFGLSTPLVLWYLRQGWLELKKRPKIPTPSAQLSLLKALEHQLHHNTPKVLNELLKTIHDAIPQAEALSLGVRIGERFRIVAQAGHHEEIVGVEFSLGNTIIWHGDPHSFERGEVRVVGGAAYQQRYRMTNETLDTQTFERLSRTRWHRSIRSNLGAPILDNGAVIGYLNLDNFSSDTAFCNHTVVELQPYVNTLRMIIQAKQQQATHLALQLLSDTLLSLHRILRTAHTLDEVAQQILDITMAALGADHGRLSLVSADGQELKGKVARGMFSPLKMIVLPQGMGLGWATLQKGQVIRVNDLKNDLRSLDHRSSQGPGIAQLTAPLYARQGKPLGVLYLARNHPEVFNEVDSEMISAIAEVASTLLSQWSQQSSVTRSDELVFFE